MCIHPARSFARSPSLAQGRHAVTACGSIWFSVVAMVTSTTLFFPHGIRYPALSARYPVLSNSRPASISRSHIFSFSLSLSRHIPSSSALFLSPSSSGRALFFLQLSLPGRRVPYDSPLLSRVCVSLCECPALAPFLVAVVDRAAPVG